MYKECNKYNKLDDLCSWILSQGKFILLRLSKTRIWIDIDFDEIFLGEDPIEIRIAEHVFQAHIHVWLTARIVLIHINFKSIHWADFNSDFPIRYIYSYRFKSNKI